MATNPFWKRSGGVKVPHRKLSQGKAIEQAPLPEEVIVPMGQHLGAPAVPLVKKKDEVKAGQLIAEPGGFISANIHSPVSGTVKNIITMLNVVTSKPMEAIVIESDGQDRQETMPPLKDWKKRSNEDILARIKDAGIVGLGGATFPTHVKLSPPPGKTIDTIILNGAECEPYITSDHRTMLEHGSSIVEGIEILMKLLDCKNVHVAIEKNKPDAIARMKELVSKAGLNTVQITIMPTVYPMGAEKTLVKNLLDREVPMGGLPLDVGVVVQNVSTVKAVHDAVVAGRPLIDRVVTVTGSVGEPKNLMVRFGTPASALVEHCGGVLGDADEVIFGGPMMGISQFSLDAPITKGTNCVLIKKAEVCEERDCFRCSSCIDACPMGLMPTMYVQYAKKKRYEECAELYHIDNCVECGSCTFSCPAKIPLVQYIKVAKAELRKLRAKK